METLKSLHDYTMDELNELYEKGERPDPDELDGHYSGGVPAVSSENILGTLSRPTYLLSKLGLLPWSGKTFSGEQRRGDNRLLLNQISVAPFEFLQGTSKHDGDECLILDYDLDENSFLMKYFRDEVRRVEDHLVLGQMYFKPTSNLVLYFALEQS